MDGESEELTIISHGVKLEGKISSSGSIRVDGIVQGDVISEGNVSVGEQGEIIGQVKGQSITLGGKVSGMVNAKEKVTLEAKANLKGDIFTKILVIEARFDGKSNMGDSSSPRVTTTDKNETGPK